MRVLQHSRWIFLTGATNHRPSLISQEKMDLKGSFETHTWMIARLIEGSKLEDHKHYLSHYVIAACYEKMIIRMNYRVSTAFRDALNKLPPTFVVPTQFPLISTSNSNNSHVITYLLKYEDRLKLQTPIKNLVNHKNNLYNQETYADFHSILREVLDLLLKSLNALKSKHHNLKAVAPSLATVNDIIGAIDFIAVVAGLLRLLVKGQAIKRCLYTIIEFLPDRMAGLKKDNVDNEVGDDERDRDEEDDDREDELEEDDESDLVGQDSLRASIDLSPKLRACSKLLNLGVVYIDAILVLSGFVKKQSEPVKINVQVLLAPFQNKDAMPMLPWKTLLQHETYFPGKPDPSAKNIVKFLELQASSTASGHQKSSKSQKLPVSTDSPETITANLRRWRDESGANTLTAKIEQTIVSLTSLQFGDTTTTYIQKIIKKLNSIKQLYHLNCDLNDEMDDIMEMLRTLSDNTRLQRMLRKDSPLDTGVGFKGSLHAEVSIAAYCTDTNPKWSTPVIYFIIMFCQNLLILLVA